MAGLQRHFHQRLLGGVCGGLAARFNRPRSADLGIGGTRFFFSVAFWRVLFLLLFPLTLGSAALLYLALWFWLPVAPPVPTVPRRPRQALRRGILLALAILVVLGSVVLWRAGRLALVDAVLLAVLLCGVLACFTDLRPRGALILPLLALGVLLALLLWRFDALSSGMVDLLRRGAPAPLLFLGGRALVRGRQPGNIRAALANGFALGGTGALCALFAVLAFARHDARLREDAREAALLSRALPDELRLLRIELSAVASDIIVERALTPLPQISGTYAGSANHRLELACNGRRCADDGSLPRRADGTADFHIRETRRAAFPPLLARGRGELRLQLPGDAPVDLLIRSRAGELTLSLAGVKLERLNVELAQGDALVSLPGYAPMGTPKGEAHGSIALEGGSLTLRLPAGLDARFTLIAAEDVVFPNAFFAREGDALVALHPTAEGPWSHYRLQVKDGSIRLIVAEP